MESFSNIQAVKFITKGGTSAEVVLGDGNIRNRALIYCYGECPTAGWTAAKVVPLDGFVLEIRSKVTIKFFNTNTASAPTMNVNQTGAKTIRYNNANISSGQIKANHFYEFLYDGTYWQLIGDLDTDSHNTAGITAGASGTTTNAIAYDPYIKIKENGVHRSQIRLVGGLRTTIKSDASGNIQFTDREDLHNDTSYMSEIITVPTANADITSEVLNLIEQGRSVIYVTGEMGRLYLQGLNELTIDAIANNSSVMRTIFGKYFTHPIRIIALRNIESRYVLGDIAFMFGLNPQSVLRRMHSVELIWTGILEEDVVGPRYGWQLVDYMSIDAW
ncbi:MAG: hypothetical protein ACTTJH_00615 [Bacteroidales bacterium]